MATQADAGDTPLSPDGAFAVLGNEIRMEILHALGEAEAPMSFSALRDHVGVRDSGQFNYHLGKLVGHFLDEADDGYELTRAGERIIEAVLSGAVTETPVIAPTQTDWPCTQCGAPTKISYQEEWVALSCTECPGLYGDLFAANESAPAEQLERGYLGGLSLPPAAIAGRSPSDVIRVAWSWDMLERLALSSGICPRCSAAVDRTVEVCSDHDPSEGLCEACDSRARITHVTTCTNCPAGARGPLPSGRVGETNTLAFVTSHGYNPLEPSPEFLQQIADYDEELLSEDPFRARFTFSLDGDRLRLTFDEDLNVVEVG